MATKRINGVRIVRRHEPGCTTEMYMPDAAPTWRDRAGGLRGVTHRWRVFACNSTQCHAEVLVREDKLAAIANAALEAK